MLSLQVSRDMKSIAAGPLRQAEPNPRGINSDHFGVADVVAAAAAAAATVAPIMVVVVAATAAASPSRVVQVVWVVVVAPLVPVIPVVLARCLRIEKRRKDQHCAH